MNSYQCYTDYNLFSKDFIFPINCKDAISSLSFYSINNNTFFALSSWDGLLNIYTLNSTFNQIQSFAIQEIKSFNFNFPLLSIAFQVNSPLILYGSLNGSVGLINLINQKEEQLYSHEIGAKKVKWIDENVFLSGGWDGCLFMKDIRMKQLILLYQFPHRIYALDIQEENILIGLSEGKYSFCKFSGNNLMPNIYSSSLKYQITDVALMSNSKAFALSSNTGGIEVKFTDSNTQFDNYKKTITNTNDYCFVTHINNNNEVYPINSLLFNSNNNTLVTGGGDGLCIFWDIEAKKKLYHGYMNNFAPLISCVFSREGNFFLYSTGQDYYKGKEYAFKTNFIPRIGLHSFT